MTLPGDIAATAPAARRSATLARLLRRYRYIAAAADQIAVSLLNFALTFSLVRLLPPAEFGTFGLWLAAANLAIGVHSAVVCMPLSVHAPAEADEERRHRLEEAVANVNVIVVLFAVLVVLVVEAISDAAWAPSDLVTAAAIPLFIGVGLYREYFRSLAFGRQDMSLLLATDAPYIVVTAASIGAMLLWPRSFAGLAGAFAALTLGGGAAQLCASLRMRQRRRRIRLLRRGWTEPYRGIFGEMMWSMTGVVATHVHSRSYAYITTGMVGLAELAALNAVGFLFRPAQILLMAWRRTALPDFAALLAAGRLGALQRKVVTLAAAALAAFAGWSTALWVGWPLVAKHLFAGKYPEASLLLLPWTLALCLDTLDFVLSTVLQAAREFRFLAYVTIATAPITVAATAGLTWWHGYAWTMYGLAIGNALGVAMVIARLYRVRRRLISEAPAVASGEGAQPARLS